MRPQFGETWALEEGGLDAGLHRGEELDAGLYREHRLDAARELRGEGAGLHRQQPPPRLAGREGLGACSDDPTPTPTPAEPP